jgi:hypothetical protein
MNPTITTSTKQAQDAQAGLAELAKQKRILEPIIARGQQAETALRLKIRTRLGKALADEELLPVWLTTALGPAAPATRTEQWVATVVDVLIYRLVYQVSDPVVALGTRPTESAPHRGRYRSSGSSDRLRQPAGHATAW